LGQW